MEIFNQFGAPEEEDDPHRPRPRPSHSDEEIMLASSRPKKRAGRIVFKETRHPVYRGVRRRNKDKWVCELREPNKKSRIWLGTYPSAKMAARAHDVAALALRGRSACLNFADSAWRVRVPDSKDPAEIQRAAAEAARAFANEEEEVAQGGIGESGGSSSRGKDAVEPSYSVTTFGSDHGYDMMTMMELEGGSWFEGQPIMSPPRQQGEVLPTWWDEAEGNNDVSLWSWCGSYSV
ncbi:hypothetical protein MLD38_010477 [Melastoma candidum]|nr:hypothetical protein MLD38_010477 [Melastoma candidum]